MHVLQFGNTYWLVDKTLNLKCYVENSIIKIKDRNTTKSYLCLLSENNCKIPIKLYYSNCLRYIYDVLEYCINWETHTISVGAAGMFLPKYEHNCKAEIISFHVLFSTIPLGQIIDVGQCMMYT